MPDLQAWLTAGGGLVVVVGGCYAAWRRLRHPWGAVIRFVTRLDQTINGKPAELDAWGRQTSEAIPPLAEQVSSIKDAVQALSENDARLTALETTVAEHGQRLTAIEAGHQIERSLGHVAHAKTFDAIEAVAKGRASADAYPGEEPDTEL